MEKYDNCNCNYRFLIRKIDLNYQARRNTKKNEKSWIFFLFVSSLFYVVKLRRQNKKHNQDIRRKCEIMLAKIKSVQF